MPNNFIPRIGWVKFHNPYSVEENTIEDDNYDNDTSIYDTDEKCLTLHKQMSAVMTPLGIIPLSENSSNDKVYNFWLMHSNFPISQRVAEIIEKTSGVETLDIYTKYRLRVGIGKLFGTKETIERINNNLYSIFKDVKKN